MAHGYLEVKCYVDSCQYWVEDNYCGADTIEVDNKIQMEGNDMEIGALGKGAGEAVTTEGTCCRTYKPRKRKEA